MGWFDVITDAVDVVADVVVDTVEDIGEAAAEVATVATEVVETAVETVGTVAEVAAPFAGAIGTMVGGPVGGMIGNAVGGILRGDDPFAIIDHALDAVGGSGWASLASALVSGDLEGMADAALEVAGGSLGVDLGGIASAVASGDLSTMASAALEVAGGQLGVDLGGVATALATGDPMAIAAAAAEAGGIDVSQLGGLATALATGDVAGIASAAMEIGGVDPGPLASLGGLAQSFLGNGAGAGAAALLEGDLGSLAETAFGGLLTGVMGEAGATGAAGVFGSVLGAAEGALEGAASGDAGGVIGTLLGGLKDFGQGGSFGAVPGGGSLVDGWEGALATLAGQVGDIGGGALGTALAEASDGFDIGDVFGAAAGYGLDALGGAAGGDAADGGFLGSFMNIGSQLLNAGESESFGGLDLGSFGSALEGLGLDVGQLSGVNDLVENLAGGEAGQLLQQLTGSGELGSFVQDLTSDGVSTLLGHVGEAGGDAVGGFLGQLDGGGAQALLGKLAQGGGLEQTLGEMDSASLVSLVSKLVTPDATPAGVTGSLQTAAQDVLESVATQAAGIWNPPGGTPEFPAEGGFGGIANIIRDAMEGQVADRGGAVPMPDGTTDQDLREVAAQVLGGQSSEPGAVQMPTDPRTISDVVRDVVGGQEQPGAVDLPAPDPRVTMPRADLADDALGDLSVEQAVQASTQTGQSGTGATGLSDPAVDAVSPTVADSTLSDDVTFTTQVETFDQPVAEAQPEMEDVSNTGEDDQSDFEESTDAADAVEDSFDDMLGTGE